MKIKIEWIDGSVSYYSVGYYPAGPGEIQYLPAVISDSLSLPVSMYAEYRQNELLLTIDDTTGELWERSENFKGSVIEARDCNSVLLSRLFIVSMNFSTNNTVEVRASSDWSELSGEIINPGFLISRDNFPNSPDYDTNEPRRYPFFSGQFASGNLPAGGNSLQAWRIEGGPGARYIVGEAGAITAGRMPGSPDSVLDPAGNSIAGFSFSSSGNIFYVSKAGEPDYDYVSVNFSLTAAHILQDVFQDVGDRFFVDFGFANAATDIRVHFDKLYLNPIPGLTGGYRDPHIAIVEPTTGPAILRGLCEPWLSYRVKPNSNIAFDCPLPDCISPIGYQENLSRGFTSRGAVQFDRFTNTIETRHGLQAGTGEGIETRSYRWLEGISRNGGKVVEIKTENPTTTQRGGQYPYHIGWNQGKIRFSQVSGQPVGYTFEIMPVDAYSFQQFDYLYFSHDITRGEFRLYLVVKKTILWGENKIIVEVLDWSHIWQQDNDQGFLFQSQPAYDLSDIFPNYAINGWAIPSGTIGTTLHTLGDGKYTTGHVSFDGSMGKAWGTTNYAEAWQLDGDFLVWAWVRIANNQFRIICEASPNVNNSWDMRILADGKPAFVMWEGGVVVVNFQANSSIPLNTWTLVVFAKNGSDSGFYIDGSQDSYHNFSHVVGTPYPFSEKIWTGYSSRLSASYTLDLCELSTYRNPHGPLLDDLSPTVGITDSFPAPTGAITSRRGLFIDYS